MSDTTPGGGTNRAEAQKQAQTAADDARNAGESAYRTVRDEAGRQADHAQGRVASEAGNVAEALRRAAEASRDGSPQERTFGQIADAMADVSDAVERKDMGELLDDASHFARRNPAAFLGGAALLGFAAARFAKASREPSTRSRSHASTRYGSDDAPGATVPNPPRDPVPVAAPNPGGMPGGSKGGLS